MKCLFEVDVVGSVNGEARRPLTRFTKEYDLQFVPLQGMPVCDLTWKEPRCVESVILNIDDATDYQYVSVHFGIETVTSQRELSALEDIYASHGWESPAAAAK